MDSKSACDENLNCRAMIDFEMPDFTVYDWEFLFTPLKYHLYLIQMKPLKNFHEDSIFLINQTVDCWLRWDLFRLLNYSPTIYLQITILISYSSPKSIKQFSRSWKYIVCYFKNYRRRTEKVAKTRLIWLVKSWKSSRNGKFSSKSLHTFNSCTYFVW